MTGVLQPALHPAGVALGLVALPGLAVIGLAPLGLAIAQFRKTE